VIEADDLSRITTAICEVVERRSRAPSTRESGDVV
jgi:hypothetical protein